MRIPRLLSWRGRCHKHARMAFWSLLVDTPCMKILEKEYRTWLATITSHIQMQRLAPYLARSVPHLCLFLFYIYQSSNFGQRILRLLAEILTKYQPGHKNFIRVYVFKIKTLIGTTLQSLHPRTMCEDVATLTEKARLSPRMILTAQPIHLCTHVPSLVEQPNFVCFALSGAPSVC